MQPHKTAQYSSPSPVFVILKGKGCLTGCGLHGHSLVSVIFLMCQSNIAG